MNTESVFRRIDESCSIEMLNEPTYTFGSVDNVRRYMREEIFGDRQLVSSCHGVICTRNGEKLACVIIGADGGASGVHERSLALLPDVSLVAVGRYIACLQLPLLALQWAREVDQATCFGIYLSPDQRSIVSHGELEISRLTLSGDVLWQSSGRDIFTGDVSVDTTVVHARDFNGDTYLFDLETGRVIASSGSSERLTIGADVRGAPGALAFALGAIVRLPVRSDACSLSLNWRATRTTHPACGTQPTSPSRAQQAIPRR